MATTKTQSLSSKLFKSDKSSSGVAPDPFAAQRKPEHPYTTCDPKSTTSTTANTTSSSAGQTERRYSGELGDEWDASKTPPSRFQQRKGSIYATQGTRDGHVDRNYERDHKYHEKLAEKGWAKKERSGSKGSA